MRAVLKKTFAFKPPRIRNSDFLGGNFTGVDVVDVIISSSRGCQEYTFMSISLSPGFASCISVTLVDKGGISGISGGSFQEFISFSNNGPSFSCTSSSVCSVSLCESSVSK